MSIEDNVIAVLTDKMNRGRFTEQLAASATPADFDKECLLDHQQIGTLVDKAITAVMSQPMLLELDPPLNICGDIHGQFLDLLWVLECGKFPPESNYLFLGDMVDRGKYSIEVICLMMAYKVEYPSKFYMLRGNHECNPVNENYGFKTECTTRYKAQGLSMWNHFGHFFNCLPVAAVVGNKIFCVHGGLSPNLKNLDNIKRIRRPIETPAGGLLCDLVWSDPDKGTSGWTYNAPRAISYRFGADVVRQFLERNKLSLIVRAHELVKKGYEISSGKQLITIFSAPNYTGIFGNNGAIMTVTENFECFITSLNFKLKKDKNIRRCEPKKNIFKML